MISERRLAVVEPTTIWLIEWRHLAWLAVLPTDDDPPFAETLALAAVRPLVSCERCLKPADVGYGPVEAGEPLSVSRRVARCVDCLTRMAVRNCRKGQAIANRMLAGELTAEEVAGEVEHFVARLAAEDEMTRDGRSS